MFHKGHLVVYQTLNYTFLNDIICDEHHTNCLLHCIDYAISKLLSFGYITCIHLVVFDVWSLDKKTLTMTFKLQIE